MAAFEAVAAAARRSEDPRAYHAALALYTGELLPEERSEDWAAGRREALREAHLAHLVEVARLHGARGQAAAIAALGRAVAEEPAHEEAHRELMRLYALMGRRRQALRQYEALRAALRRELDAEPEPASRRLYAALVAGGYPPAGAAGGQGRHHGSPARGW